MPKSFSLNIKGDHTVINNLLSGKEKISILLPGGGQACIIQAGFLEALEDLKLHSNISSIYGNSGGTIIGWNFIAHAVKQHANCMYQEHIAEKFVHFRRIGNIIDTTSLSEKMITTRRIDFKIFKSSHIKLIAGVTDHQTGKYELLEVPRTTIEEAINYVYGSFAIPFISKLKIFINNRRKSDGSLSNPLPIKQIQQDHKQILIILTTKAEEVLTPPVWFSNLFSGYLKTFISHLTLFNKELRYILEECEKPNSGICLIYPNMNLTPYNMNEDDLKMAEQKSYEFAKELLNPKTAELSKYKFPHYKPN